jgi:hypothetical protein
MQARLMSLKTAFGPFAVVFERGELDDGYLELLHLDGAGTQPVIARILTAIKTGDTQRWVTALLHDANWRPHLVGAIALLLDLRLDSNPLWAAIDGGSWVIPQLVVTAAHVDPRFREHVRERVGAHCPVVVPSGLSSPERHSATGPEGLTHRSAKMLASMLAMSREFADLADWREAVQEDQRSRELLAADASWNNSDRIVESWLSALRSVFRARGCALKLVD